MKKEKGTKERGLNLNMKKHKDTKEKILDALEDKPKMKMMDLVITSIAINEINELREKLGLGKLPKSAYKKKYKYGIK